MNHKKVRWLIACGFALIALYPAISTQLTRRAESQRLSQLQARLQTRPHKLLDAGVALRLEHLSPLLASWETIGGCGAGGTGGVGTVKWIGRNTMGGL